MEMFEGLTLSQIIAIPLVVWLAHRTVVLSNSLEALLYMIGSEKVAKIVIPLLQVGVVLFICFCLSEIYNI